MDAGPIVAQREVSISYPIRIRNALELQSGLMADLALDIIAAWQSGALSSRPQDESKATYSLWRDEADYNIDWSQSASEIRRFIDAVSWPYSGARTTVGGEPVTIDAANEVDDLRFERRDVGKIWRLDTGRPVVVCGSGLLRAVPERN